MERLVWSSARLIPETTNWNAAEFGIGDLS
jgi:hypothetical protein